jgi:hypothetical protein
MPAAEAVAYIAYSKRGFASMIQWFSQKKESYPKSTTRIGKMMICPPVGFKESQGSAFAKDWRCQHRHLQPLAIFGRFTFTCRILYKNIYIYMICFMILFDFV